jgi:hypothetical protein
MSLKKSHRLKQKGYKIKNLEENGKKFCEILE